jgi:hypothetical protein
MLEGFIDEKPKYVNRDLMREWQKTVSQDSRLWCFGFDDWRFLAPIGSFGSRAKSRDDS